MNVDKRQKQSQKKVGVDIMSVLLGNIQVGKLKSRHVNLMRREIEAQTQQVPDPAIDIRAVIVIIRVNVESTE